MSYAVQLELQIVHLRHDRVKSPNFGICVVYQVASRVVHGRSDELGLLGQMVHLLGDLLHEAVEVPSQLREGAAVQKQKALRGGSACCARRVGPTGGRFPLRMLKNRDLVAREAQLTDGDALGCLRRRRHGHKQAGVQDAKLEVERPVLSCGASGQRSSVGNKGLLSRICTTSSDVSRDPSKSLQGTRARRCASNPVKSQCD